jgi:hypothetical protein
MMPSSKLGEFYGPNVNCINPLMYHNIDINTIGIRRKQKNKSI